MLKKKLYNKVNYVFFFFNFKFFYKMQFGKKYFINEHIFGWVQTLLSGIQKYLILIRRIFIKKYCRELTSKKNIA